MQGHRNPRFAIGALCPGCLRCNCLSTAPPLLIASEVRAIVASNISYTIYRAPAHLFLPNLNPQSLISGFSFARSFNGPLPADPSNGLPHNRHVSSRPLRLPLLSLFETETIIMRPDKPRDPVAGPDAGPEAPFPVRLSGPVIKGFGRGSKEVGAQTHSLEALLCDKQC